MTEMTADEIVRALADANVPLDTDYACCALCFAEHRGRMVDGVWVDWPLDHHEADCPWRLAREYVTAHPVPA